MIMWLIQYLVGQPKWSYLPEYATQVLVLRTIYILFAVFPTARKLIAEIVVFSRRILIM